MSNKAADVDISDLTAYDSQDENDKDTGNGQKKDNASKK
jgi:hypothetical protein